MEIDAEKFARVKADAETFYKAVGEIYCPYLKEAVAFNAKGLDHIKFKDWNRTRLIEDQFFRLKLLHLAPQVLKESHTLQEFREMNRLERQKINSRWESRMIRVSYFGFVAILGDVRIKVVVKDIDGGKKFFWSIYPHWKQWKDQDGKIKKVLHEGDLETQ